MAKSTKPFKDLDLKPCLIPASAEYPVSDFKSGFGSIRTLPDNALVNFSAMAGYLKP